MNTLCRLAWIYRLTRLPPVCFSKYSFCSSIFSSHQQKWHELVTIWTTPSDVSERLSQALIACLILPSTWKTRISHYGVVKLSGNSVRGLNRICFAFLIFPTPLNAIGSLIRHSGFRLENRAYSWPTVNAIWKFLWRINISNAWFRKRCLPSCKEHGAGYC